MIELDDVAFAWPGLQPDSPPAFAGLSLKIGEGEKVVLLGANGCGKSTLLKLLDGLVAPTAGAYRYAGETVTPAALKERGRGRRFRQEVALLFQHPEAMLFNPTVFDEVAYTPRRLGLADADARAARWLAALGLDALAGKAPFNLSGGEKQKVALAAVLAVEPKLLLLDEPSASLDPRTAGWLVDLVQDSPATVIVSTHNLSLAAELGERCLILGEDGRFIHDGPVEAALADLDLLERANLAHRHRHRHGRRAHAHAHRHDWESS